MFAKTDELQRVVVEWQEALERKGLNINACKVEVMIIMLTIM